MQNEMGMRYFARPAMASGARGMRGPCHRRLFLEWHQKDLQRRCKLYRKDPGAAWWPGDVH
jgi:hypothetical protein